MPQSPALPDPGLEQRIDELDTLAAILPADRCEQLAHLLTDEDVETLRHLAKEGIGENTLRALMSDFGYLEAWSQAASGAPLPWPAPESLILKFIAHHLWDPEKKKTDPAHGIPADVAASLQDQGLLRTAGVGCPPQPHAPATVQRRLANWSTLHRWRGLEGEFSTPGVRSAMRLAVRVADRPRHRKSRKPVTAEVLEHILETCENPSLYGPKLADLRDRALLLVGFASGGRRRSEVASLRLSQISFEDPVPADPDNPQSPLLPVAAIRLGRTKTEDAGDDNHVIIIGRPVVALKAWLEATGIEEGAVFRAIDQWGNLADRALSPQSVNAILKTRIERAGYDPADFSAQGLRSGFLTEAANRDIPLQDAMLQSRHKSLAQASSYYNEAGRGKRRSARLFE